MANFSDYFALVDRAEKEKLQGSLTPARVSAYIVSAKKILKALGAPEEIYLEQWEMLRMSVELRNPSNNNSSEYPDTRGEFIAEAQSAKQEDTDYENEIQAKPAQLPPHDIDLPEEPEEIQVVSRVWNPELGEFTDLQMGKMLLIPTGCERPEYLSPYENEVTLKPSLPRDVEKESNLYAQWQQNQWVSRRWVQEHLDQDINIPEVDKEIADDIPFILAAKGMPDPTQQVAQTAGMDPGSNNGAPLPPGPGPGRGNKVTAGDNLASKAPPNGAAGSGV